MTLISVLFAVYKFPLCMYVCMYVGVSTVNAVFVDDVRWYRVLLLVEFSAAGQRGAGTCQGAAGSDD